MLRAAWMNDKDTFDKIFDWTEKNLSRKEFFGDNLLAWKWKDNQVSDWMPAADADIDYAFSLILADLRWAKKASKGQTLYLQKAKIILRDVLSHLTHQHNDGNLYLLPWILKENEIKTGLPQNPSYYSPAYFRVFYSITKDKSWLNLIDTYYLLLNKLNISFDGIKGVGIIPDWVLIDEQERCVKYKEFSSKYGWEAVRIPWKVYLDFVWFKSKEAEKFLNGKSFIFLQKEFLVNNAIYAEYLYNGDLETRYEHPLFYFSYYLFFKANETTNKNIFLKKVKDSLVLKDNDLIYISENSYYENSLLWYSEVIDKKIYELKKILKDNDIFE